MLPGLVLGYEFRSSAKTANDLTHWAISQAPNGVILISLHQAPLLLNLGGWGETLPIRTCSFDEDLAVSHECCPSGIP